jgi:ABC-2 type transport system ATP-binding protein
VTPGTVFGFLGPNGAGKTTAIMILLGNVRATAGRAWLLGRPAGDVPVRRRVGFLPEKFQFHDFLTATEFLRLHGRLCGMSYPELARRVPEVLEVVGLAVRARSRLREFSKGMQQRIGLAQAILHDPDLVILDEPTSALDPLGRRHVRDVIRGLKERGKTVFLNSHLLSEIEQTCDEVAILKKGEVVAHGRIPDLLAFSSRVEIETRGLSAEAWTRIRAFTPRAERHGDQITAWVAGEEQVADLARLIVESGARLISLIPHRETLEECFVRLVGE